MLRTYYCFLLFSCLLPISIFGQITGIILDSQNKDPIEYATIVLMNDAEVLDGTISKQDGSFEINVSPKTNYAIEISFLGYETQKSNLLNIGTRKEVALGEIFLRPTQTLLDEVVLSKNLSSIQSKIDRQVYGAGEFSISRGGNAADLIRNIPSISINANGEISVRGSRGFVILLNDKPIQSDIKSLLNQIPANSIRNIEVITAPSAKYDSEGKAGIINILTLKNVVKGDYFQVNTLLGAPSIQDYRNAEIAQRYGADITFNTVSEKWNLSTGFSFQRNDLSGRREGDVYTIIGDKYTRFPSDGERSFDEINYSSRLTADYQLTEGDLFSIGLYAGKRTKDRTADILYYANYAIVSDIEYEFQYYNENLRIRKSDFILGSLDYEHKFKNEAELSSSILYEYTLLGGPTTNRNLGYPDSSIIYQDEYNTNNNPLYGLRINLDYQFRPLSNGTFEIGYQYRNLDHTGDFVYERKNNITQVFELVPEFSSEVNLKRSIHSGYVQYNGSFKKWTIASGLRVEDMQRDLSLKDKSSLVGEDYSLNFIKLFPSARVNYKVNDKTNIKLAYSKRIERTTTFKVNPFPEREHSETLEQGDPNLHPELIDQLEIGINYKNNGGSSLFSTIYYRNEDNLINRVNTVYNDTILNRIYSNVGNAKAFGGEIGSEFTVAKKLKTFTSVNLYNYKIDGKFDNRPISSDGVIYSLNLNSTYSFSDETFVQFNFNYLSNRVTAQGEDSRFYSPNLTVTKRFWNNQLTASLQWKNIDMGLMNTNEQQITTSRPDEFYTTTNYVYEVDMILLSLSYNFNDRKNTAKFTDSEFGKREF